MPVDKCKFEVFKGITVHTLYYYHHHHHRRVFFSVFKLNWSHTSENKVSPRKFSCLFSGSQQRKQEQEVTRLTSDEMKLFWNLSSVLTLTAQTLVSGSLKLFLLATQTETRLKGSSQRRFNQKPSSPLCQIHQSPLKKPQFLSTQSTKSKRDRDKIKPVRVSSSIC